MKTMSTLPTVGFDTRGVNQLEDGGAQSEPLMKAMECDFTDELCVQQRKEQFELEKRFEKMWTELRPKLDQILAQDQPKRPTSYRDAVGIATEEGGILWGIGT